MSIEPALTTEEWASVVAGKGHEVFDGCFDRESGVVDVRFGGPAGIRDEKRERHAFAATLLYGEPFGFTWEDVDCLMNWTGDIISEDFNYNVLQELAIRIAALLPPREPSKVKEAR